MKIELRNYIVPTIPMAVLLLIFITIIWFAEQIVPTGTNHSVLVSNLVLNIGTSANNSFFTNLVSLLLTALNAFLVGQLNIRHTIIRTRSFLPVIFFFLLMASWRDTHLYVLSHIALSLFLLALFVLFSVYRDRNASEQAFLSSFLIALASVMFAPVILFIPLIWIGLILFHSFSIRNFLASLIGVLSVWIVFIAIRYYFDPELTWLTKIPNSFEPGFAILSRPINEVIYIISLFIILILGIAGLSSNINQDSMQTRSLINFNIWLLILSFIFSMIFMQFYLIFMPFVAFSYATLLSHPLTLKKSNFYGYVFIAFIVVNVAFVISNIILPVQ